MQLRVARSELAAAFRYDCDVRAVWCVHGRLPSGSRREDWPAFEGAVAAKAADAAGLDRDTFREFCDASSPVSVAVLQARALRASRCALALRGFRARVRVRLGVERRLRNRQATAPAPAARGLAAAPPPLWDETGLAAVAQAAEGGRRRGPTDWRTVTGRRRPRRAVPASPRDAERRAREAATLAAYVAGMPADSTAVVAGVLARDAARAREHAVASPPRPVWSRARTAEVDASAARASGAGRPTVGAAVSVGPVSAGVSTSAGGEAQQPGAAEGGSSEGGAPRSEGTAGDAARSETPSGPARDAAAVALLALARARAAARAQAFPTVVGAKRPETMSAREVQDAKRARAAARELALKRQRGEEPSLSAAVAAHAEERERRLRRRASGGDPLRTGSRGAPGSPPARV